MTLLWTRSIRAISAGLVTLAVFNASPAFAVPTLRVVSNTNDSGDGSLRQAIIDADASNTDDSIVFGSGITGTITLTSGSLVIENSLSITCASSKLHPGRKHRSFAPRHPPDEFPCSALKIPCYIEKIPCSSEIIPCSVE
jgi:hypothetical protein